MNAPAAHAGTTPPPPPRGLVLDHVPIKGVVAEHAANATELLSALRAAPFELRPVEMHDGLCTRCDAHLDALRIAGPVALDLLRTAVPDDDESAGPLALLLAESEPSGLSSSDELLDLLTRESWAVREAAWWGLRLARPRHLAAHLDRLATRPVWDFASAAAVDALAFHRIPVHAARKSTEPNDEESVAWLLAEASGRVQSAWDALKFPALLTHASARVRAAALRASARCSYRPLLGLCRRAAEEGGDPEKVGFLGVIGTADDLPRLQRAASNPATASAAVRGLGRLGLPAAVPSLLLLLEDPRLADEAGAAVSRITGCAVPRGAVPNPPAGMSEDELDVWDAVPPLDVVGAREWWAAAAGEFDPAKRWQAGFCVSDHALGPTFDRLPLALRHDVYLRERASARHGPDWELETWSWRQRDPGRAY